MLKTKTKVKFLLALGIMLLAVLVFNVNPVNAVTQEEAQALLNAVPEKFALDITEAEYEKAEAIIEEEVKTIWKNKGLSTEGMDITIYGAHLWDFDINTVTITISGNSSSGSVYKTKKSSISYSNSNQRNSTDEQYVKNLNIKTPEYLTIDFNKNDSWEEMLRIAKEYYNNNINDKNITIDVVCGAGGGEFIGSSFGEHGADIGILKNGIVYDIRIIGCLPFVPQIIIPDTIKDTDEDYINYAMPIIKKWLKEQRSDWYTETEINNITITKGGTVDYWNYNGNKKHSEFSVENGYTVKINSEYEETATIILKKSKSTSVATNIKKEDTTTGIKLETTTNVVPSNVVLTSIKVTDQNVLNTVKETLKDISTKYTVYDINLLSDGVKIQPNGKVKISVPVPTEYNKSNIVVYRVADNGDKTEYAVAINGDVATFETDHFSTYVLAEKEVKQNTGNTDNTETTPTKPVTEDRKKDDTPKTGTIASIYFIIPVTVISAIGIIAFRRKETK